MFLENIEVPRLARGYDWKFKSFAVVTSVSAKVSVKALTKATIAVWSKPKAGTEKESDAVAVCCDVKPV
jgi:hypothetical protein